MITYSVFAAILVLAVALTGHLLIAGALFLVAIVPFALIGGFETLSWLITDHGITTLWIVGAVLAIKGFLWLKTDWETSESGQDFYDTMLIREINGGVKKRQIRKQVRKNPQRYSPVIRNSVLK